MPCYSRTDYSLFERQGDSSKETRKQDREERQPIKGALSSTLLLWVARVQSH